MNILLVHQNFPAQFKHLAPALVRQGHRVVAMHMRKDLEETIWEGVILQKYGSKRGSTPGVHNWIVDFETKVIRAEACFRTALKLKEKGFTPDIVIAHHGWGESLFVKEVWPEAKVGIYCEFYYSPAHSDSGFDPEFPNKDPAGEACRLQLKNLINLLHFEFAVAGISPTAWQASTFPDHFHNRISVIHDGIDTEQLIPDPEVSLEMKTRAGVDLTLTRDDEVITFVNRNLEPYRGYHTFMRALPELLKRRPNARVMIVGGDDVSYGPRPDKEKYGDRSWKQIFQDEVRADISNEDWARVHFVGKVPYSGFVNLLQLSTVHVYLTYPFVLSWSLLEAMSVGAAIIASDTPPVKEVIKQDETGRLVDFFDSASLTDEVCRLLDDPAERARLGANAREFARQHYDLKTVCLPKQLLWVEELAKS